MSRIGNQPIVIPEEVSIKIKNTNFIEVVGKRGALSQKKHPDVALTIEDGICRVSRSSNQKRHKALQGLYRSLISNMVIGVTQGFHEKLEIIGIGYKVDIPQDSLLDLHLGYAHNTCFLLPKEVRGKVESAKGKNLILSLESNDKQLLGQVVAKIKSLRKPEPYKGKGIRKLGEYIRRKVGKTAGK